MTALFDWIAEHWMLDPFSLFAFFLSVAALGCAIFACIRVGRRRTIQNTLLILENYTDLRKQRSNAIMTSSPAMAETYYMNSINLVWVSFSLWLESALESRTLLDLVTECHASFAQDDAILVSRPVADGRRIARVTYREIWAAYAQEHARFNPRPSFVIFLDMVHRGEIEDALRKRRSMRRGLRMPKVKPEPAVKPDAENTAEAASQQPAPFPAAPVAADAPAEARHGKPTSKPQPSAPQPAAQATVRGAAEAPSRAPNSAPAGKHPSAAAISAQPAHAGQPPSIPQPIVLPNPNAPVTIAPTSIAAPAPGMPSVVPANAQPVSSVSPETFATLEMPIAPPTAPTLVPGTEAPPAPTSGE